MRVSIFSHSYTVRENQKNIDALAEHVSLNVLLPHRSADRIFETVRFEGAGVSGETYRVHRRLGLFRAQYLLLSSDLNFRDFQPDLIVVEYDPWSTIFWQAMGYRRAFAPRAAVICAVKNNTYRRYPGARGRLKFGLASAGVRRVDHFMAASRAVADLYQETFRVAEDRIEVIQHLGVDTALFEPTGDGRRTGGPIRVGYCGRLDEDKGVDELFEAVRSTRENVDLRLDYLGDGQLRGPLTTLAREHDWFTLRPRVPHDQVPAFLATLDLFVLPSRVAPAHEEHDAHALLEAMAMGLPCVGTRSGITPEILEPGTGLLVDPNSADALCHGLKDLVLDPDQRATLGTGARERAVASFSVEAVAARRARLFREVVDAG